MVSRNTLLSVVSAFSFLFAPACGGEGSAERDDGRGPVGPNVQPDPAEREAWAPTETPDGETPVGFHGQLRVEGSSLLNAAGDPVQLKGVSTMWLNWEQQYALNKDGLRWMRDNWGLSVIRAAMGIEPAGAYLDNPSSMVSRVRGVVRNAIELGVYVIIDWHDHNAHEHVQESVEFFQSMADEFGEYPNVLYETYNEPERVSWPDQVKPYHDVVTPAIRERDPDNVIILGTPFWSQAVNLAAQDPVAGDNLMYTVHFYACEHRGQQRQQAQQALDLQKAIFVTEWGATVANGGTDPNGQVCDDEAALWHQFMDDNAISWAAWKLDDCADLSCLFRPAAPSSGGWTDEWLNGHAPFVRDRMLGMPY